MKFEIPEQFKAFFVSLHGESEAAKQAYSAGWDAALIATAKKLRSIELQQKEPVNGIDKQ